MTSSMDGGAVGMLLPRRCASSIHMSMTSWICWSASSWVDPSAMHPGRFGAVAIHARSSSDHSSVIGYLFILDCIC